MVALDAKGLLINTVIQIVGNIWLLMMLLSEVREWVQLVSKVLVISHTVMIACIGLVAWTYIEDRRRANQGRLVCDLVWPAGWIVVNWGERNGTYVRMMLVIIMSVLWLLMSLKQWRLNQEAVAVCNGRRKMPQQSDFSTLFEESKLFEICRDMPNRKCYQHKIYVIDRAIQTECSTYKDKDMLIPNETAISSLGSSVVRNDIELGMSSDFQSSSKKSW